MAKKYGEFCDEENKPKSKAWVIPVCLVFIVVVASVMGVVCWFN